MRTEFRWDTKEAVQAVGDIVSVSNQTLSLNVPRELPYRQVYLGLLVMGNNLVSYDATLDRFDDSGGRASLPGAIAFQNRFGSTTLGAQGVSLELPQAVDVYDLPFPLASTDSPPSDPPDFEDQIVFRRQFADATAVRLRDYVLKLAPFNLCEAITRLEFKFSFAATLDSGFSEGKWVAVLACKSSEQKL